MLSKSGQQLEQDRKFCDRNGHANKTLKNLRTWRHETIAHVNSGRALSNPAAAKGLVVDRKAIQELIDNCFVIIERWCPPDEAPCLDGTTKEWPEKFDRYIKDKESYRVVLESIRFRLLHEAQKRLNPPPPS